MTTQSGDKMGQNNADPCKQLNDLLPAYSIGATTHAETMLVESLLADCPEVAKELPDYVGLSTALLNQVEPIAPPAHLHDKLMSAIQTESTLEEPSTPNNIVQFPSRRMITMVGLVAVSLLVLTNIYWALQVNELRDDNDQEIASIEGDLATLITLITDDAQQTHLSMPTDDQQISATVVWSHEQDTAFLYTANLPPLTEEQIYQLWLIDDEGVRHSGGIFNVDDNGHGVLIFNPPYTIGEFTALGISTEPKGGSEQPTSDPVAVGQL